MAISTMIPILILTHTLLGVGIRSTLEQVPNCQVQSTSLQDPEEIDKLARLCSPAVTILDDTSGNVLHLLDQLGRQRVRHLGMMVVVTAECRYEETLFHLAKWGVAAYLSDEFPPEHFITTVRRVSAGEWLLSSEGLKKVSPRAPLPIHVPKINDSGDLAPGSPLSALEVTLLTYLAQDKRNKEIARLLKVSEQTVKNHLAESYAKLGVPNRTAAVARALQQKWIEMPHASCCDQASSTSAA